MPIIFELSNFDKLLYDQSVTLITCFKVFTYDATTHLICETSNADEIRKELGDNKQLIPLWLSFSTGYELLFKAVLAKHKVLNITKGNVSKRKSTLLKCTSLDSILNVYHFIEDAQVSAKDGYLKSKLTNLQITNLYTSPLDN